MLSVVSLIVIFQVFLRERTIVVRCELIEFLDDGLPEGGCVRLRVAAEALLVEGHDLVNSDAVVLVGVVVLEVVINKLLDLLLGDLLLELGGGIGVAHFSKSIYL